MPSAQLRLSNSFADIIEKASPAVVKISMTRIIKASEQQGNNPFMSDPFFRQFFGGPNARPRDQREQGLGFGVIVSPSGYILTNNHVVEKASSLKVDALRRPRFHRESRRRRSSDRRRSGEDQCQ